MEAPKFVLTMYRIYFSVFKYVTVLVELIKNEDAIIFPLYYSLKVVKNLLWEL